MTQKITRKKLQTHLKKTFPKAEISESLGLSVITLMQSTLSGPFASVLETLRDDPTCCFQQLTDITAVDRLHYGVTEWEDNLQHVDKGYAQSQAKLSSAPPAPENTPRFVLVFHLLSLKHNQRLRVKLMLKDHCPAAESATNVWPAADWYEREVYDLFGVTFNNHPDLRRILTDYGFVGHPFRKDFPVHGKVDLSYDAKAQRCVYKPVDIEPHQNSAKVIRRDNRYETVEKNDG